MLRVFLRHVAQSLQNGAEDDLSVVLLLRGKRFRQRYRNFRRGFDLRNQRHQTGGAFLYAESAEQLLPLYGSLGKLLSLSLPTYRLQWTVQADAFTSGHTLLGKVRVNTGTGSIDVPFLIRIP